MTVSIIYTGEGVSIDGSVTNDTDGTWDAIHDAANGTSADDSSADVYVTIFAMPSNTGTYDQISRGIVLFDTSDIAASDIIDSATFGMVVLTKYSSFSGSQRMVTSAPASNTALATGDYGIGTVAQATSDILLSGITADSSTYTVWTLNATGLGNITKGGITKFGHRSSFDADDSEPTWGANYRDGLRVATANEVLTSDKRAKLTVTHTSTFTPKVIMF